MKNKHKNQKAFSLIETIVYIFITVMLLLNISSLVLTNFNIRRQLKTADLVYNDARFIISQLNNKLHAVNVLEDLRPDPEQLLFYCDNSPDFVLIINDGNLILREVEGNTGPLPIEYILNSDQVAVSNLVLTPIADDQGNLNKGVLINFTLTTGVSENTYNYLTEDFQTFISLR